MGTRSDRVPIVQLGRRQLNKHEKGSKRSNKSSQVLQSSRHALESSVLTLLVLSPVPAVQAKKNEKPPRSGTCVSLNGLAMNVHSLGSNLRPGDLGSEGIGCRPSGHELSHVLPGCGSSPQLPKLVKDRGFRLVVPATPEASVEQEKEDKIRRRHGVVSPKHPRGLRFGMKSGSDVCGQRRGNGRRGNGEVSQSLTDGPDR